METRRRLEAERVDYRDTALHCEGQAKAALERGDRLGWDKWARAADSAWRMNAHVVGLLDALEG